MTEKSPKKGVVTRFPPSPTGYLHIGRARTALFNFLFARQNGGKLIFRLEDTDSERSKEEYAENIVDCLAWLGLSYDNLKVERQSQRKGIYTKYLKGIIDSGKAYISQEENVEEGKRSEVIRFKNPNVVIRFNDLIRGEIEFDTTDLGDFVIARSVDDPLYHLAVVVDDFEMGITHVIRGDDGISNTPRQILIQEAIGAPRPIYAHIPLILAPDRSKLSGRHGAVAVTEYREKGYFPEAIINYLALLGWNPGTEQEIFSMDELIKQFDLTKVQKAGAIFNEEKLKWINKQYLAKLDENEYLALAEKFLPEKFTADNNIFKKIANLARERISVLGELKDMAEAGEFDFFFDVQKFPKEKLLWKDEKDFMKTKQHLAKVISILAAAHENDFSAAKIKELVWPYAEEAGRGNVLWPTRYALSGKDKSPDPFTLAELLGKDESLKRIQKAHDEL